MKKTIKQQNTQTGRKHVLYPIFYEDGMQVHIIKGNRKLGTGVYCFNTLPGGEYLSVSKGILTNVPGTCVGVCDGCEKYCYAVRDAKLHHNAVIKACGENTVIMRHDLKACMQQIHDFIERKNDNPRIKEENKIHQFRWHSSGEIESVEQIYEMNQLALDFPMIHFGTYTKRFDILEQYCRKYGKVADNFTINLSVWKDNYKGYDFNGNTFNYFEWDDGDDDSMKGMFHCPAVNKPSKGQHKGHRNAKVTCTLCGRCYHGNKGLKTAVYNH